MKETKKILRTILSALFVVTMLAMLCACGTSSVNTDSFSFTGSGVFADGNTYNVTVANNQGDDKTFTLSIEGVNSYTMSGTWEYVENKGYKLYFDDNKYGYAYANYNTDSKSFEFDYLLNLGDGFGITNIRFAYPLEAFAKVYDGVGLGNTAPVFYSVGYIGMTECTIPITGTLTCLENGTCVALNHDFPEEVGGSTERWGTWTYDEAQNAYTILFNEADPEAYYHDELDEPQYMVCPEQGAAMELSAEMLNEVGPYVTTYDETTNTYSIRYEQVLVDYCFRTGTWTPAN